jgi:2-keto-4-pentenoate hydratase
MGRQPDISVESDAPQGGLVHPFRAPRLEHQAVAGDTMPIAPDLRAIARELKSAQDRASQLDPLTSRYEGLDLPAAYEVAHLIHQARCADGATPVGRKIGFTNPAMWALYGVREPIWAHVYDTTVVHAPGGCGICSLRGFAEPKIEPEIIFRFRSAPPVGEALDAILESIDWIAHGFEIVQSHFPGWRFQAADTVADGSLHGMLFIGDPQPAATLHDDLLERLASFSVTLSCDGVFQEVGRGSNVLGSPLAAIAHLVEVLRGQTRYAPLQAGEIVTTGTITTARPVRVGEKWNTRLDGIALPGFTLEFTQ